MTRPMTHALDSELNALTASERRVLLQLAADMDGPLLLARVIRGFAAEVRVMELVEAETLHALALDRLVDLDVADARHPYPPTDPAKVIFFDPDADRTP